MRSSYSLVDYDISRGATFLWLDHCPMTTELLLHTSQMDKRHKVCVLLVIGRRSENNSYLLAKISNFHSEKETRNRTQLEYQYVRCRKLNFSLWLLSNEIIQHVNLFSNVPYTHHCINVLSLQKQIHHFASLGYFVCVCEGRNVKL
jgi:hypothetical protein